MANKFVWSGAGGANDGSSWDNAYTSLMRNWGAEAGFTPSTDFIYVRSVHAESTGAALTFTGTSAGGSTAAPRVICCVGAATGTSPGALATGASVTTTGTFDIFFHGRTYIYGVEFYSSDDIEFVGGSAHQDHHLEACRVELTGADSGDRITIGISDASYDSVVVLTNTDLDFSHASQGIISRRGTFHWIGGTCDYDVGKLLLGFTFSSRVWIAGVDLSALTSSSLCEQNPNTGQLVQFVRCLLATGMSVVGGTIVKDGHRVETYHCQSGTDADPAYQLEIVTSQGTVKTDTARYRTGGGKDPERTNPISWDMDTTVGSVRGYPGHPLRSPPITAWADGDASTSHTYRIAIASDATIKNDEFWIELEGPNDAATDSKAVFQSSRVAPLTTAANLTTDASSSWTGTGVGTKQYAEVSYTPDKPGPVTIRCYMAKGSDHIYVDPKIQIDP